jgi:2-iminobutanoate/2-iminopropanoate deaminase
MTEKVEKLNFEKAPTPIGPFSHAVKAGNFLFITGQMPTDPNTNEMILGTFGEQTSLVMKNLKIILDEAGSSFTNVVQSRVFITNMGHFAEVNQVYRSFFGKELPARTCIGVTGLAGGADVEIDMVAWIPETEKE